MNESIRCLAERLAAAVNAASRRDGSPSSEVVLGSVIPLISRLGEELDRRALGNAYAYALRGWARGGCRGEPSYGFLPALFRPDEDSVIFYVGVNRTTNSERRSRDTLEFLLAVPDLPDVCRDYAHRHGVDLGTCTPARIIVASKGYTRGNCVTLFSEDVRGFMGSRQCFGVFLLEKFRTIFEHLTVPLAREAFPGLGAPCVSGRTFYEARCVWAVAHERFHQSGAAPLRDFLEEKLEPRAAAIEEFRVDAAVARDALCGHLPHARLVARFVLLDRGFRYPAAEDAGMNFDSAAGLLMRRTMEDSGVMAAGELDLEGCRGALLGALDHELRSIELIDRAPSPIGRTDARRRYLETRLGPCGSGLFFPAERSKSPRADEAVHRNVIGPR